MDQVKLTLVKTVQFPSKEPDTEYMLGLPLQYAYSGGEDGGFKLAISKTCK